MRKVIFFALSSVIVCMSIIGAEHKGQESALALLLPEMIYKTTQYCGLQSIGRFKQVNKQLSEYDISKMICYSHGENEHNCFSVAISELAKKEAYRQCSGALSYFALKADRQMFSCLYDLHEKRDEGLREIYEKMPQVITVQDRIQGYSGFYLNKKSIFSYNKQLARALCNACKKGELVIAQLLIENGADVNGDDYSTPLCESCKYGNIECVKLLIKKKADVNKSASPGPRTPLFCACSHKGDVELIRILLANGAIINGGWGQCWDSPLSAACCDDNYEVAKLLIENGADLSFGYGYTKDFFYVVKDKPAFKELIDSMSFFQKKYKLMRTIKNGLLAVGVSGLGYCLYNEIFNS